MRRSISSPVFLCISRETSPALYLCPLNHTKNKVFPHYMSTPTANVQVRR